MEDIKQIIIDEIAKTELQVERLERVTKPVEPDEAIGRLTRMEAIGSKSVNEAALRQAEDRLRALKYVLTKVDEPDFGICVGCNQPIAVERLLVIPESTYCIDCAN